ncbi:amino acid adenylation domain-containing protein [Azospirillum sp. A26]|uniref:amino acid adenylation domain-containing protein n=1 Tax=Azospirillum sp. A26 TaxID=3160607 RepID=UPI00366A689F
MDNRSDAAPLSTVSAVRKLAEMPVETLVGTLVGRAAETPGGIALRFIAEGTDDPLSYADLDRRARAIAVRLRARAGLGDRAVLLLPSGPDYVAAFFGCLYAGVIAVPAYPPESVRPQHLARLQGILADAQPRFILTDSILYDTLLEACRAMAGGDRMPELLAVDRVDGGLAGDWSMPPLSGDDIAFLQYTSGSTSAPKGVRVSHGNLIANERLIRGGFGIGPDDCIVSWLPLFHDMGLIGGLLQPIHAGIPCVLMSPRYFLERPRRWLEAIGRYGGTISGGPDFAFRLCCERIADTALEGLDLGSWRLAFSGSEPIRPDTLARFAERFAPVGFDRRSYFACYGLAEATLFVTGGRRGQGITLAPFDGPALAANRALPPGDAASATVLAGCGHVQPDHPVRLVDPAGGSEVGEGTVGEIWAGGPSIADGYWRNAEATARSFVERDGAVWLRTGDLGFLKDGELFVTGRLKDMLIVRGQNIYPQDLERSVEEEVEVVRKGRVAAFAVEQDGREGIGIAAEIGRTVLKLVTPEALCGAIAAAVADSCQEAPVLVALLEPGALPKTSSGKLQRSACRSLLDAGELPAFHVQRRGDAVAATDTPVNLRAARSLTGRESEVATVWSEVLGTAVTDAGAHFFALGGNSVSVVQVVARLRERCGLVADVADLFRHPTLSDFAARLSAAGPATIRAMAPQRGGEERIAEPSAAQARMWFNWKLDPRDCGYTISGRVQLRGPLRRDAVQAAVDLLVERHESLRTVFREEAGRPVQVVRAAGALPVAVRFADLSGDAGRDGALRRLLEEEVRAPFDLVEGPLMRVQSIACADDDHHLQVSLHHAIADGWSMSVLLDEFGEAYAACCGGRVPELPALTVQYADVARWQRDLLESGEGARQLAYWTARLGDRHPVLDLPADRPRSAGGSQRGAAVQCAIDDGLATALRGLARRMGVTLPTLLLASYTALLHRYSGQDDIRVGCTLANRRSVDSERLIGFFVNMAVLCADLSDDPAFDALLRRVGEAALDAQANQDLPFDRLVEELQPQRDLAHHPLFQAAYDHQWQRLDGLDRLPGLRVEAVEHLQLATQFDLILHTTERAGPGGAGPLGAFFTYSLDLFEPESVERMARHWLTLLRGIVADPALPVTRLPLMNEAETAALVAGWNDPARNLAHLPAPLPADAPGLHARIAALAHRHPDAPAVTCDGRTLSYGELDRRSDRLAWQLRSLGVGPDRLVGLAADRSFDLIVGMLGILKAGGGYLPLDPSYPADRLLYMQADSGIGLVVTQAHLRDALPLADGVRAICVGEEPDAPDGPPPDLGRAGSLAYCIYTSGSTGQPKGVAITHANVLRLFESCPPDLRFDGRDVWALFHSYAFDFSVWEIFGALLHGGRLVVVPYYTSRSPADCFALLRDEGVTVLNQTPSAFRQLVPVALGSPRDALSLRLVVFGGEALEMESLRGWFEHFGDSRPRLVNMYGITETTVHVTHRLLTMADLPKSGQATDQPEAGAPVGMPLGDLRWYFLDRHLQPVPPGVAGEIHVGGAGLARAYLNRPALTAGRFVADPFGRSYGDPGGRLYRSGDLARYWPDGRVEYLGRADQQIKLRGFRIEPGEIEAAVRRQPAVADAAVLLRGDGADRRLVAYAVADEEALRDRPEEQRGDLVGQWNTVFDGTYSRAEAATGPSFTGWNDSYDDRPIPEPQMREWLDATVARILALKPERLLEIGCGVGLLTQAVAPRCAVYHGTDFSAQAIADLGAWAAGKPELAHIRLSRREATDFGGLGEGGTGEGGMGEGGVEGGGYDTVVINSVAQYFPDGDYLLRVLEGAVRALRPGGRIFLGDLRPLHLQPLFHASVALRRAEAQASPAQLRARVARAMAEDGELLFAPGFFQALRGRIPEIGRIDLDLRCGRADNELTRYRFDAVLHVGAEDLRPAGGWREAGEDLTRLDRLLAEERPAGLRIAGIANRRLTRDLAAWMAMSGASSSAAGALRERIDRLDPAGADPDAYRALAEAHGYRARVGWSVGPDGAGDAEGRFDVEIFDPARLERHPIGPYPIGPEPAVPDGWRAQCSDPLLARQRRQFAPRLLSALRGSLPAHMVPSQILRVDRLPLTVNGKLDRDRLADHDQPMQVTAAAHVPPESPVEQALAAIWAEVLGVTRIGLDDDFFELGGHSLLATQVASRIAADLGVTLDIRTLFEATGLRGLVQRVEERRAATEPAAASAVEDELAAALKAIEGLSEAELNALADAARTGGGQTGGAWTGGAQTDSANTGIAR